MPLTERNNDADTHPPPQVRRIRKATCCNINQFCQCFPFTVKAMTAMEREPDKDHKLRPPTPKENEYLLEIARKWHVNLEES